MSGLVDEVNWNEEGALDKSGTMGLDPKKALIKKLEEFSPLHAFALPSEEDLDEFISLGWVPVTFSTMGCKSVSEFNKLVALRYKLKHDATTGILKWRSHFLVYQLRKRREAQNEARFEQARHSRQRLVDTFNEAPAAPGVSHSASLEIKQVSASVLAANPGIG